MIHHIAPTGAPTLRSSLVVASLWFFASFGGGILFRDALDAFTVLGVPAGFWFAQQGAIWVFPRGAGLLRLGEPPP